MIYFNCKGQLESGWFSYTPVEVDLTSPGEPVLGSYFTYFNSLNYLHMHTRGSPIKANPPQGGDAKLRAQQKFSGLSEWKFLLGGRAAGQAALKRVAK